MGLRKMAILPPASGMSDLLTERRLPDQPWQCMVMHEQVREGGEGWYRLCRVSNNGSGSRHDAYPGAVLLSGCTQ